MTTGRQALEYAERQLGVHQIYEEAQRAASMLTELRNKLVELRRSKRIAEMEYSDSELEFIGATRETLSDMSQAAFDRHIKVAVSKEPNLRAMRARLAELSNNLDSMEAQVSHAKVDVEVATARMTELGGYFAYLAAIKTAETARHYGDNWPSSTA